MAARLTPSGGSKSDKIWRDAIHRAVKRTHKDGKTKRLEVLADSLIDAAIAGDVSALREVGDRLDGKAPQGVHLGGDKDNPVELVFRWKS